MANRLSRGQTWLQRTGKWPLHQPRNRDDGENWIYLRAKMELQLIFTTDNDICEHIFRMYVTI